MTRKTNWIGCLSVVAFVGAGCAGSESPPSSGPNMDLFDGGGSYDYGSDGRDAGAGTNEFACGAGQHLCGLECVADRPNAVENGCRLSCTGEACTSAGVGVPYCTDEGRCSVECPAESHACGVECVEDRMDDDPATGCRMGCGDPCPVPPYGEAICTEGRCDFTCSDPAMREGDACVCVPKTCGDMGAECGTVDDGCGGTLTCGGCADGTTCVEGSCGCPEDPAAGEPNETIDWAHYLGRFRDRGDSSDSFHFKISHLGDVDWFMVNVEDNFDFGNPQIRVELSNIPEGHDYDLAAWFTCDNHNDDSRCDRGTWDSTYGDGCVASHPGTFPETVKIETNCEGTIDDDGIMYIRVTPVTWTGGGMCHNYRLYVRTE